MEAQRADKHFGPLIQYLKSNMISPNLTPEDCLWILQQEQGYALYEGVLYRIAGPQIPTSTDGIVLQLVVPEEFRLLLLEQAHSTKYSGHLGFNKVLQNYGNDIIGLTWRPIFKNSLTIVYHVNDSNQVRIGRGAISNSSVSNLSHGWRGCNGFIKQDC